MIIRFWHPFWGVNRHIKGFSRISGQIGFFDASRISGWHFHVQRCGKWRYTGGVKKSRYTDGYRIHSRIPGCGNPTPGYGKIRYDDGIIPGIIIHHFNSFFYHLAACIIPCSVYTYNIALLEVIARYNVPYCNIYRQIAVFQIICSWNRAIVLICLLKVLFSRLLMWRYSLLFKNISYY